MKLTAKQRSAISFAERWNNGELVGSKATKRKAAYYLRELGDWLFEFNPSYYSMVTGCIEWHNYHDI